VIYKPTVSIPQIKSNQLKDKVLPNNSQVEVKKTQVEVHPRNPSVSNKIKSVTACKDSLNSRTLNANVVCATCNKCLVDSNHFACVIKMLNDMHDRTKKPTVVPISTRKPKSQTNKSIATPHKKNVASKSTKQKPQSYFRVLYENTNKAWKWVYYVEGINHNLFSVVQFCDADLEVAFRKSTCFVRDLQGNDLLVGNHRSDVYTISLQESTSSTPLHLMAKATPTQAWLWHRRLSHRNFDYINLLSKKDIVIGLPKLKGVSTFLFLEFKDVLRLLLVEAISDGGMIGLAISLPFCLHMKYSKQQKGYNKQYQNEVNELRAEKLARNANPLALVATAQACQDQYYQTSRDKDIQKNLALIAKYFKKIYKPTNNNLRTSLNSKNKNVDTPLRYKRDEHSRQFGTQRILNVVAARENVGSVPLQVEQHDWLADTDEEVDEEELEAHYSYMAKIQKVPTADSGTDSEPMEQLQNKTRYNVFANHLQNSEQFEYVSNTCLVETDDSNATPDSLDMCEDDIQNDQNDVESDYERVALASLIANLKLDVDENKKTQKQLKKANKTLAQELKECKAILAETSKSLGESISVRDSCLVPFQIKQAEFEKYEAFNDRTVDYGKLESKLNEALGQLAHKDTVIREDALAELQYIYPHKVKECDCLAQKLSKQTNFGKSVDTKFDRPSVVRQPNAQRIPKPSVLSKRTPFSDSFERRYFPKKTSVSIANV
nr:retrovirus-related Pol polyprotein from transposon TNT 1-94 [Tanacetum cinerariifolium]